MIDWHSLRRAMAVSFGTVCLLFLFMCGWGVEYANRSRGTSLCLSSPESPQLSHKPASRNAPSFQRRTTEVRQNDGRHWKTELNITGSRPSNLLVLVLTANEASWGRNQGDPGSRTIFSFVHLMAQTQYPFEHMSLGLLTSSDSEFRKIKTVLGAEWFRRSHVIYHSENEPSTSRKSRQAEGVQLERRRSRARLKNYLMLQTLGNEEHVVWLDADVYWLSPGLLHHMIKQSLMASHQVNVITARCSFGEDPSYDRKAWVGSRTAPREVQGKSEGNTISAQPTADTQTMEQLVRGTADDDLIPLDSAMGTVLYLSSDIIRQGVIFPTYYAVGTAWNSSEGWDGIETEGLCYLAKSLDCGCYRLGGDWLVKHTDY